MINNTLTLLLALGPTLQPHSRQPLTFAPASVTRHESRSNRRRSVRRDSLFRPASVTEVQLRPRRLSLRRQARPSHAAGGKRVGAQGNLFTHAKSMKGGHQSWREVGEGSAGAQT